MKKVKVKVFDRVTKETTIYDNVKECANALGYTSGAICNAIRLHPTERSGLYDKEISYI